MRFTVKLKLAAAFGVVIVLSALTAVVSLNGLSSLNASLYGLVDVSAKRLEYLKTVDNDFLQILRFERLMLLVDSLEDRTKYQKELQVRRNNFKDDFKTVYPLLNDADKKQADLLFVEFEAIGVAEEREWELAKQRTNAAAFDLARKEGMPAGAAVFATAEPLLARADAGGTPDQVKLASLIRKALIALRSAQFNMISAMAVNDDAESQTFVTRKNDFLGQSKQILAKVQDNAAPGDRAGVDAILEKVVAWEKVSERMDALALMNGDAKAISISVNEVRDRTTRCREIIRSVLESAKQSMESEKDKADKNYASIRNITLISIIVSLLVAVTAAVYLALSISKGLGKAVGLADAVAIGDLDQKIEITSNDEIGDLVAALNKMTANLKASANVAGELSKGNLMVQTKRLSDRDSLGIALETMVDKLRRVVAEAMAATDNVSSGSQQLSSTSEQLAQGSNEQAAATEQASSAMEQMAANIRQTADNAAQTEKIARQSARDAEASGVAVVRAVEAMQTIVGKITVVQEIARQTDLLALNAAVEAARAGEHGKGFAVVASEVRKLAERSQAAAAEINNLSSDTVKVADEAGQMLSRLVPDIKKTAELVEEISSACREQDTGAEQVNQAILELDKVTQQNSAASEELAASSEELAAQGEQLQLTMSYFRLEEGATHAHSKAKWSGSSSSKARVVHELSPIDKPKSAKKANAKSLALGGNGVKLLGKNQGGGVTLDLERGHPQDHHDDEYEAFKDHQS